jgi:tripartite-type tricarboxylate transporter receptor subunit TctC
MRTYPTRWVRIGALALAAALVSDLAAAQSWPSRPVRLIVGFAPGGTADILARKLQMALTSPLGQPVIVENKTGASGATASAEVARANDEGHTFGLVVSTHASLAAISRKLPYDTERDFRPVVFVGSIPLLLVVKPALSAQNFAELVALAKQKPGGLSYAFPGVGLSHHFAGELLKQRAGVDILAVSYRGTAPALNDVIANQVDMTFGTLPAVLPFIDSGRVRAFAATSPRRSAGAPNIPTVAELGYPGFDVSEWFGVVAPAGTPDAIVTKLNQTINAVLDQPDLQEWIRQNSVQRGTRTPEGFGEFIVKQIGALKDVAAKSKITAD